MPMNACTVSRERTFSSVAASARSSGTSSAATIAVSCSFPLLPPKRRTPLLGRELFVRLVGGLHRRGGDPLRRGLARDDGHVGFLPGAPCGERDTSAPLPAAGG